MAFPYLDNPATLSPYTVQELDGLVAKINTFLRRQHTDDGSHTDITADSLVVDGPVTVRDERDAPSTFARTVADGTTIDVKSGTGNNNFAFRFGNFTPPEQVIIGTIPSGPLGPQFGIRFSQGSPHLNWDMVSGAVSAGFAWLLRDGTNGARVLVVVKTFGHYEVRPETFGQEVWLGSGGGGAFQRFTRGYIDNVFTSNTFERGRPFSAGDWVDVPFNAANFTTETGAIWSVSAANVGYLRYTIIGQTMHYAGFIAGTSVGAPAPVALQVALPAGYVTPRVTISSFLYSDAGPVNVLGFAQTNVAGTIVQLVKVPTTPWTVGGPTNVYFDIAFEVTG